MYIIIGLAIGFLLGVTGAGGSLFAIPLLLLFTDLTMADAMGIALSAVFVAALYGCIIQRKTSSLVLRPTAILALSGIAGAPLGRWLSLYLPQKLLVVMFFCLAMYISWWMWNLQQKNPALGITTRGGIGKAVIRTAPCMPFKNGGIRMSKNCVSCLIISGIAIGFISGMLGVGGGFMIVPALVYLSGASIPQAVCSSLIVISAVSCSGFIGHIVFSESPHLKEIAWLSVGSICGMQLSQFVSNCIDTQKLYRLFSLALGALATFILIVRGF